MSRRKLAAAKCCQGLGAKEGPQEESGLLDKGGGQSQGTEAQVCGGDGLQAPRGQKECGTGGPGRDDKHHWKRHRAPPSCTAVGVMEASSISSEVQQVPLAQEDTILAP